MLNLPRKSVVRINDHPDMTSAVYSGRLARNQTNKRAAAALSVPLLFAVPVLFRPEFFYFSFYRPSRPSFLEIKKKIKDFFQFYFFISLRLMQFSYVFSFCLFYCCQVD